MAPAAQREMGTVQVDGGSLTYEVAGSGHPLVLVHGGLVDRRLWDDQMDAFAERYRVIRYDLRGYGDSSTPTAPFAHYEDLHALLTALGIDRASIMGLSLGGGIAIETALAYPEMVDALILVGSGLEGYTWSEQMARDGQAIVGALQQGDVAGGVELMTRLWTDGPGRTPDQVKPDVRERVKEMTTAMVMRSRDAAQPRPLDPPAINRLTEIRVPTLVITGDEDIPDIHAIADLLEGRIPNARSAGVPGAAHHLNMERPEEFNRIVLDFLGSVG